MYKCHLCDIETKQLNGLLTLHWKKHCNDNYSKEQYKVDLLANNGRKPVICKFCSKETKIPKGEKDYPLYHKKCYLANLSKMTGRNNINYKGGKTVYQCRRCGTCLDKYPTMILVKQPFCSISCSMKFYALPENRTDKQKENDIKAREIRIIAGKSEKCKKNQSAALAKMQKDRKSKVESLVFTKIKEVYPDAEDQYEIDFYVFDAVIPNTKQLIEVNGNYWHNRPQSRSMDVRKRAFIKNNRPEYSVHTIWESEIEHAPENTLDFVFRPVDVFILAGPSGCGKSYLGELLKHKFDVIDYDKMSLERCIEACKIRSNKPKLLITPIQAKRMMRELRTSGIRVWSVYMREDIEVIKNRILSRKGEITPTLERRIKRYESLKDRVFEFYGTQKEVKDWLLANPYF